MQGSYSKIVRFQSPLAFFAHRPTWTIHRHGCSICGEGTIQADGIICELLDGCDGTNLTSFFSFELTSYSPHQCSGRYLQCPQEALPVSTQLLSELRCSQFSLFSNFWRAGGNSKNFSFLIIFCGTFCFVF